MKVHIELETSDKVTADEIHEWLCLTIHERNETALETLQRNVHNITVVDEV